jgi:ribosome biogenesis GTPase
MNRFDALGWSAHWDGVFAPFAAAMIPGRVRIASRDHFVVFTADGEMEASAAGKLRLAEEWPVTGDWVGLASGRIEVVLPRRTSFVRRDPGAAMRPQVIAANADVAFLVMGLDGDYNLRRLERYLYLCSVSGVRPVIVLNKSDLCSELEERCRECERLGAVVVMSALHGTGLGALLSHVSEGETAVLLGSSGAGKSTIANRLRGFEALRTAPVRVHDSRGMHTTTHRELIPLDLGWLLMDVPGLRELQLWSAPSALDGTFEDVSALAALCRFRDCRHGAEPGCAVRLALSEGRLDEARWGNYLKMQREIAHLERTFDPEARAAQKQYWKSIHKAQRKMLRERGR